MSVHRRSASHRPHRGHELTTGVRDSWRKVRIAFLSLLTLLSLVPPATAQTPRKPSSVVISVHGEVTDVLRDTIIRRINAASQSGAEVLIFEIDTFGGYVTSGLEIHQTIQGLPDHIRTIAWVNQKAISAGAMIAMSCDEIWMNRSSSIGDCAPIVMGNTDVGEAERAKMESPILNIFRDSAARHNYPTPLVRAMVQVGAEVWWIERDTPDSKTPERRLVDGEEKRRLVGDVKEGDSDELTDVFDHKDPNVDTGWRLAPNIPADIENPVGGRFEIKQPIDGPQELLTLTQSEAVVFGLAKGIASDLNELSNQLDIQYPEVLETNSWEHFAAWLNHPIVRAIFFLLAIVGIYIEIQAPGMILPGAIGLLSLLIFFAAPYVAGLQYYWPIALLMIGVVLLGIELMIPGFGVFGITGLFAIFVALIGTFLPTGGSVDPNWIPPLADVWQAIKNGMLVIVLSLVGSIVGLVMLLKYMPKTRMLGGFVLGNPEGVMLTSYTAHAPAASVGDIGVVVGHLKPGGQVRFGNEIVEAMSQGEYVQPGVKVQVIRCEGMNVIVRSLPDDKA